MAIVLPGKFIFLAHPHTGSSAMMLALQDAFPEAMDLRPHHMTLADVKGEPGAVRIEQISRQRAKIYDVRRPALSEKPATIFQGNEHVFTAIRNPYDFLVSCYVRRGRERRFEDFVRSYDEDPYVRDGRLYYHFDDCDTVLRHERLQRGLNSVMKRMNLPDVPLGRHNETKGKKPWETYYTPEAFKIVNERFGTEFFAHYMPRVD